MRKGVCSLAEYCHGSCEATRVLRWPYLDHKRWKPRVAYWIINSHRVIPGTQSSRNALLLQCKWRSNYSVCLLDRSRRSLITQSSPELDQVNVGSLHVVLLSGSWNFYFQKYNNLLLHWTVSSFYVLYANGRSPTSHVMLTRSQVHVHSKNKGCCTIKPRLQCFG